MQTVAGLLSELFFYPAMVDCGVATAPSSLGLSTEAQTQQSSSIWFTQGSNTWHTIRWGKSAGGVICQYKQQILYI